MMTDYDLNVIGIEKTILLYGNLEIIQIVQDSPTVFLIDENHDNPNDCIAKNAANAMKLIEFGNVVLVGVESHSGGQEWDQYDECYIDEFEYHLVSKSTATNTCPEFANSLVQFHPNKVYGVESFGLLSRIETDYGEGNIRSLGVDVRSHVFQRERSRHFIRTLFDMHEKFNLDGNMILNCGSDHNSHIEEWIRSGEIEEISRKRASFIRLNSCDQF